MRIRLYRAFASNNSGSYTLVGAFRDPAIAEDAAAELAAMCAAHSAWYEADSNASGLEASPLRAFATQHALLGVPDEAWDHWPEHGAPPTVIHLGHQVLVYAPYTVTMPRALGEYLYKRGGRVSLELDHSHDELACEFTFWIPDARYNDPATHERIAALRAPIDAALPALVERSPHDKRPAIAPAWHRGHFQSHHLSVAFSDPGEGILAVRELARAAGIATTIRIYEIHDPDPFATLRGDGRHEPGHHRVTLWTAGPDRVAVMKVVRDLTGVGLAEARALVDELPQELLANVSQPVADQAARSLVEAGATAEAYQVTRRG
ncbi:MAG: ribosomal protein L7/L12 [Kofleriaceae bacterium]